MKKRELAETFDGLCDAMAAIDVRALVEEAEEEQGHLGDSGRSEAVEHTVDQMEAMVLGYAAAMVDASDITTGEDEVGDADEYALNAFHCLAAEWHRRLAKKAFASLRELIDAMVVDE